MRSRILDALRIKSLLGVLTLFAGLIGCLSAALTWVLIGAIVFIYGETDLFVAFWLTVIPVGLLTALFVYVVGSRHEGAKEPLDE